MSSHLKTVLSIAVFVLLPLPVAAQNVTFGYDAYNRLTTGNSWDFSAAPIPPDFFGPGSDPFDGLIQLQGHPLGATPDCPTGLNTADTIVKRIQDAILPSIPSTDVIDIELVELDLVGISPITVTYSGGSPELWDVNVTLSQFQTSTGTMSITKTHPNGGMYTSELYVRPRFTFTRVSDNMTVVLDDGSQVDTVTTVQSYPWVYSAIDYTCPGCSTNFIPGNDGNQEVPITLSGARSSNAMVSDCEFTGVMPALSEWGLILLLFVIVTVGSVFLMKGRRLAGITNS